MPPLAPSLPQARFAHWTAPYDYRGLRRAAIVHLLSDNYYDSLVSWRLMNTRMNKR